MVKKQPLPIGYHSSRHTWLIFTVALTNLRGFLERDTGLEPATSSLGKILLSNRILSVLGEFRKYLTL